jgi:hypothetical protein
LSALGLRWYKRIACFFFALLGLIRSFSQNRLMMMPRHTLDPFVHVFELVMGTTCPLQAQNMHNKNQSVYRQNTKMCLGITRHILDGKGLSWEKGRKEVLSFYILWLHT